MLAILLDGGFDLRANSWASRLPRVPSFRIAARWSIREHMLGRIQTFSGQSRLFGFSTSSTSFSKRTSPSVFSFRCYGSGSVLRALICLDVTLDVLRVRV